MYIIWEVWNCLLAAVILKPQLKGVESACCKGYSLFSTQSFYYSSSNIMPSLLHTCHMHLNTLMFDVWYLQCSDMYMLGRWILPGNYNLAQQTTNTAIESR